VEPILVAAVVQIKLSVVMDKHEKEADSILM